MLRRPVSWLTSAALILGTAPMPLRAQQMVPKGAPSMQAPEPVQSVQSVQPGAPEQPQAAIYSPEQLDAILAPIALYPDVLLTQVLMASGFPLQLIEAARWVQANRGIAGQALERALLNRNWDPSVKSLTPFPAVLAQMTGNLEWLQDLGTAALQQQPDVLDSIQRLRQRAEAAGNLRSSSQQIVRTEERYIYIEPAQPELVYVPAYNPVETYGTWAYPAYPPVYLAPPVGYGWAPVVGGVLAFGVGVAVVASFWNLGRPRWHDRHIHVDRHRYNTINVNRGSFDHDTWNPRHSHSFNRGGLGGPYGGFDRQRGGQGWAGPGGGQGGGGGGQWRHGNPPGPIGGPGAGPGWRGNQGGGPGGGGAPGHQFRDRGGPGTAGNSGIVPPGHGGQFRGQGGGDGQNFRRNEGGGGGGGQQFRRQEGGGVPGGGGDGQNFRRNEGGGGGGGGQQFRRQEGGGVPGGGGGGGGGQQFRRNEGGGIPSGGGGGGGQNFRRNEGGGGGGGGGGQFRGQGGGGGAGAVGMPSGGGGHGGGGHGGGGGQFRSQGGGGGGASVGMPSGGGGNRGGGGGGGDGGGGGGGGHNQRRNNNN